LPLFQVETSRIKGGNCHFFKCKLRELKVAIATFSSVNFVK
jgi:hypothetical protein